jgi:uncharacterized protein YbjT (DUF2867 family)
MQKSIILLGASGLIGNEVLRLCLENKNISEVKILVRKSLGIENSKLTEIITDLKDFDILADKIQGNTLVCCLGTTRKKTPNLEDYRNIDYGITLKIATIAKQNGVEEVHLISAVGADSKSRIFYNRLKGETEMHLCKLDFKFTTIYRPSLLIGPRHEFRMGELIAQKLAPIFDFFLSKTNKFHSISYKKVANALVKNIFKEKNKTEILEYSAIQSLLSDTNNVG